MRKYVMEKRNNSTRANSYWVDRAKTLHREPIVRSQKWDGGN